MALANTVFSVEKGLPEHPASFDPPRHCGYIHVSGSILANQPACGVPDSAVELLLFGGDAEKFIDEVLEGAQTEVLSLTQPRLGVDIRIGKRDHKLHIV